jgi:L-seryl-tRNA(Ser) seleniumtransferase
MQRRTLFRRTGLMAALTALGRRGAAASANRDPLEVYTRLGLRPIINAAGTYTHLGGSLMPPEVIDAMNDAAKGYVPIRDLTKAAGERIAQLTGNEAALVTTGAAGAIFAGTCACIAGDDPDKARRLPFTDGMKNEVVVQKLHNTGWTRQCEAAGARMIEVEHKDQMERAINGRTAMLYFLVADKHFGKYRDMPDAPGGKVSLAECIAVSKTTRTPLLVDAAAELPPAENLSAYTRQGVDLVAFSGGKGLRGPQNAGLLLGRKDLVDAAYVNSAPNNRFARIAKVGKEEIVGLLTAVEIALKKDEAAERRQREAVLRRIADRLTGVPTVKTEFIPNLDPSHSPRLSVQWDEGKFGLTVADMVTQLREGEPAIVTADMTRFRPHWKGLGIFANQLRPGEDAIVAKRVRQILTEKAQ